MERQPQPVILPPGVPVPKEDDMPEQSRIPEHISVLESINREHFTLAELAELLGVSERVVIGAIRRGELNAYTVDHHVQDITRADALAWLNRRLAE